MYSATTDNIFISVWPKYEPEHSDSSKFHFVFSYEVLIKNNSDQIVQLLKRHWIIKSADGIVRDVKGEGVIGEQPVLNPGDSFQYNSWAPISSEIGNMSGEFLMKRILTEEYFNVTIPTFQFVADPLLN